MAQFEGSAALKLDFGGIVAGGARLGNALRLAPSSRRLRGPDKYKVLDHRRRQAQIKARRALDLIYAQELTIAQAAERLGIPVNTVKSRLLRARQALRRWLKHEDIDHA